MRVLVVGAKGFVGAELSRSLLARGHHVIAFEVRASPGRLVDVADDIEWRVGDAASQEAVLTAVGRKGVDAVYYGPFYRNQPGEQNVERELDVMAVGSWRMFNLARVLDMQRILFPSSTAVHGYQPDAVAEVTEDSQVAPIGIYGATKLLCERIGDELNSALGHNVITSVRLPSIYGPGADVASRRVNVPAVAAARRQTGRVDYLPSARLCIAHVGDTATALADMIEQPTAAHSLYELGGLDVSFGEIVDSVHGFVPDADIQFGGDPAVCFPHRVNWTRGQAEFGFRHRPLAEGIRSILDHESAALAEVS